MSNLIASRYAWYISVEFRRPAEAIVSIHGLEIQQFVKFIILYITFR
jgi:hypothetical protein